MGSSPSQIVNEIDEEEQTAEAIYKDFWALLLQTRLDIAALIKKCKSQQRNVRMLLKIIQKCQSNNGELSNDDRTARQECIQELGEWMNTDETDALIKKWLDIQTRLKVEHKKCEETSARVSAKKRNQWYKNMVYVFLGVLFVGVLTTAAVVTCGVATLVVAVPVAAVGITLAGGGCVAGAMVGASYACGALKCERDASSSYKRRNETLAVVVGLQDLLAKMGTGSKAIQVELNKTTCEESVASLNEITVYLDEYLRQCQRAIDAVDQASQEMINC